jgi:hypothetical protein
MTACFIYPTRLCENLSVFLTARYARPARQSNKNDIGSLINTVIYSAAELFSELQFHANFKDTAIRERSPNF